MPLSSQRLNYISMLLNKHAIVALSTFPLAFPGCVPFHFFFSVQCSMNSPTGGLYCNFFQTFINKMTFSFFSFDDQTMSSFMKLISDPYFKESRREDIQGTTSSVKNKKIEFYLFLLYIQVPFKNYKFHENLVSSN